MTLSLFFTRGISLEIWVNQGLFDREKLIYEEHLNQKNFKKIYWLTYGNNDIAIANKLKQENKLHKDIEVLQMPSIFNIPKIGSYLYSIFLPLIYKKELTKSTILKTNQIDGSWSAVLSKWLYKKPIIARSGYIASQLEYSKQKNSLKYKYYSMIENFIYKNSDIAIVSSKHNQTYIKDKYQINNTNILYNYIDLSLFYEDKSISRFTDKILFVGRINKEKNISSLIESISRTDFELDIYGDGELKEELENFSKRQKVKVNFKGIVSNSQLPKIYNSYKYYILPSYFEGMPKTLLEAMACGCLCIGTDVNGINEIIEDDINGILSSDVDEKNIFKAINRAINKEDYATLIGNSVKKINDKFSLESVVSKEDVIFRKLV